MADVKGSRRKKADATRKKIVRAAHREFVDNGFNGATIASIAKRAGVAVQTVYFVFNNKTALISAVIDTAVLGEDKPTIPQESDWWKAAAVEPDAAEAIRIYVRGSGPIFERASIVSEIMRAASLDDPDLRAIYDHHERLRDEGFGQMIIAVKKKGRLKKGLTVRTATDLLLALYGDTMYYTMVVEHGWSHDQYIDWLCAALPGILLENP